MKNAKGKQKANLPRTGKVSFTLVSFFCVFSSWRFRFTVETNQMNLAMTSSSVQHYMKFITVFNSSKDASFYSIGVYFCLHGPFNYILLHKFSLKYLVLLSILKSVSAYEGIYIYINAFSWLFLINGNCGIYFCLHSPFSYILLHKFPLNTLFCSQSLGPSLPMTAYIIAFSWLFLIGRFSEAGLHEWMPFVIFRVRSCKMLQYHFWADFWVGVASCCV